MAVDIPNNRNWTEVTFEVGPEVQMHRVGYSLTLLGSSDPGESVTLSSPLAKFRPIKCSFFSQVSRLGLGEPLAIAQVCEWYSDGTSKFWKLKFY